MKSKNTASRSGFTLIEMMVVIAIIMLLYTLAAPAISQFLKKNSLKMTVEQTQKMISMARQMAITTAGFYAIQINSDLGLVGIYDASETDAIDKTDMVDKLWKVPRGIAVAFETSGDSRVTTSGGRTVINLVFDANGGLHNNGRADCSYIQFTDTNSSASATDRSHTIQVYRMTGVSRVIESAVI